MRIRRDLHQHPELSFQETRTANLASQEMVSLGLKVKTGVGKTGVVADLENGNGPVICLRADMDALPMNSYLKIQELCTPVVTMGMWQD